MKRNHNCSWFFFLFFFIFFIKNNFSSELIGGIFQRIKKGTPILDVDSMQLSFWKSRNLFTLYLGCKLFQISKIQNLITPNTEDNRLKAALRKDGKRILDYVGINNDFENYFAQNLKDKKYINFSTNILWYFFSMYAFFLKSDRFKKVINFNEYLSLFDKKIKKFVPYFNLIYPFATFIETRYFDFKKIERYKIERYKIERRLIQEADQRIY